MYFLSHELLSLHTQHSDYILAILECTGAGLSVSELDVRLMVRSYSRVAVFRYLKYPFGIGKSADEGVLLLSTLSTKKYS